MGEGAIAAVVSVIAALVGQTRLMSRPDRHRRRIVGTLDLLDRIEAMASLTSTAPRLVALVDEQVDYLARLEQKAMERKYDPSQPFIGLLFGVPSIYGAVRLWNFDGWGWTVAAVALGAFAVLILWVGLTGFFTPPRTPKTDDDAAKDTGP